MAEMDTELQGLIERSPFLPPDFRGDQRARPQEPVPQTRPLSRHYRFTGVVGFRGERKFAFMDLREDRGYWIPEGETVQGLRVMEFDAPGRRVMLTDGSRREWLALERPEREITQAPPPSRSEPSRQVEPRERTDEAEEERPRAPVRRRVIVPSRSNGGD